MHRVFETYWSPSSYNMLKYAIIFFLSLSVFVNDDVTTISSREYAMYAYIKHRKHYGKQSVDAKGKLKIFECRT